MNCKKVRYDTEESCLKAIKKISNIEERRKMPVRAYECPFCNGYHMTSQKSHSATEIKNEKFKKYIITVL